MARGLTRGGFAKSGGAPEGFATQSTHTFPISSDEGNTGTPQEENADGFNDVDQ
jgi:hypothetical protein